MFFGFDNMTLCYGDHEVLKDVTIPFTEGNMTAILGLNGSGKSTLLKTIVRTVKPVSGKVVLEDKDLLSYTKQEIAQKVAYLSQVHTCPPDIDVRALVSYGRFPHRKFGHSLTEQDNRIIEDALAATGMAELQHRQMAKLSGGESQRAWIAMTIAQQPKVLVLDEPTTYLDAGYQIEVLELLRSLNQDIGLTIVMVMHDLNLASRYADDIYIIGDHKVLSHGTPDEIITQENLLKYFNVHAKVMTDEDSGRPFYIPQGKVPR